ncbi:MAG TPA: hypothetical protein VFZ73_17155 [Gemmatimonadaceae bacterium]
MRRIVGFFLVIVPAVSFAQAPTRVVLPPHDGRLETGFTGITSVRELSDGRVLVTDPRDLQLVVADFRGGEPKQISRRGQGPGEYGMAGPVFRIGGDSSLMVDFMARRLLLLDADQMVATIPADNPVLRATQGFVRFADRLGHVTSLKSPEPPNGESVSTNRDSSTVLRYHRSTGKVDTITKIMDRPAVRTVVRNAKGEVSSSSFRALRLSVGEQYIMHHDGWIAVVRINPFRVDWREPDGRWTRGAPLPIPIIRMTEREKAASRARTAASMATNPRSTPPPPQLRTPDDEWPDAMPPYIQGELQFSPDGDVIIRRQPSADHPGVAYYLVDRRGRLLGVIEMKDNERIIGAGARAIYVEETDADDLKYIRRHPWRSVRLPG